MKNFSNLIFIGIVIFIGFFLFADLAEAIQRCAATLYDQTGFSGRQLIIGGNSSYVHMGDIASSAEVPSGCTAKIWEAVDKGGRYLVLGGGYSSSLHFNDKAQSVKVPSGCEVTLYDADKFQTNYPYETYTSSASDLGSLNKKVSSAKVSPAGCTATLYDQTGFSGRQLIIGGNSSYVHMSDASSAEVPSGCTAKIWEAVDKGGRYLVLGGGYSSSLHFNDKAQSVKVPSGCEVTLYDADKFQTNYPYETYTSSASDLGSLNKKVSSAKVVTPPPERCVDYSAVVEQLGFQQAKQECQNRGGDFYDWSTVQENEYCYDVARAGPYCCPLPPPVCPVEECVTDGLCDGVCPDYCTVEEDPDCGCRSDDGCCGIGCTWAGDTDCVPGCTDSDRGKVWDERGICKEGATIKGTDSCSDNILTEWYCDGDICKSTTHNCSPGSCIDGRCVTPQTCAQLEGTCCPTGKICTIGKIWGASDCVECCELVSGCVAAGVICEDSDGGKNWNLQGVCKESGTIKGTDSCSDNILTEWYCDGDICKSTTHNCSPDNCIDGKCVSPPPICAPDGCNGNCPDGCTVEEDPDCGCKNDDGCCGIGCTSANDNDCARAEPGDEDGIGPGITIQIENPLTKETFEEIIDALINLIFKIAIVLAPLMIVIGGFLFVTAGGNLQQVDRARKIIIWTVVGFLIVLLAKGLMALLESILGIE